MTNNTPLSFEDWCYQFDIDKQYQAFHDEYGDLAGSYNDYKECHYQDYLEEFKRNAEMLSLWQGTEES